MHEGYPKVNTIYLSSSSGVLRERSFQTWRTLKIKTDDENNNHQCDKRRITEKHFQLCPYRPLLLL